MADDTAAPADPAPKQKPADQIADLLNRVQKLEDQMGDVAKQVHYDQPARLAQLEKAAGIR